MTYIFLRFSANETTLAVVAGPTLLLEFFCQVGVVGPKNKIKNILEFDIYNLLTLILKDLLKSTLSDLN